MSSLLHALAYRIQEVGEELPIGQVASAADRLRSAHGLLAWVTQASATLAPTPSLTAAGEHLDHAAGAMLAAREALTGYLQSIGLPREAVPPPDRDWRAALAPAGPRRPRREPEPPTLGNFWAEAVDRLTGQSGHRPDKGAMGAPELLHRCARAALAGDRGKLRRELIGAGPAVGLGLSAVAAAPLRYLAAELLGHPPQAEDLPAVRRAALPRVRPLLPAVDEIVVDELLARACHAPPPKVEAPVHPVDSAVTGAVLVAALLGATGRDADELARVVDELAEQARG
ncbi:hypothetical protein [Phytohabitans aurantiacus]|jgi:hypothetical protein|uniref:DUF222 domain-containing protein n=1 Tax=Phytohabitans aurantiacus TaxID=3016789 RepID=A0ABQ5QN21_9ACTN|nr:hypothetical protein [Phytohabitans aurantiacus]GLH95657.1 hypothetical protein Pa4123_09290 [Phytohabitans aurantiacus]